jgi:hypothetical protein
MEMTPEEKENDIKEAIKTAPEVVASTGVVADDGTLCFVYWARAQEDGPVSKFIWFFNSAQQMEAYINTLNKMLAVMQLKGGKGLIEVVQ